MEQTLEQQAEQEMGLLWSEARETARPFVFGVLRLNIPEQERVQLVLDVVAIGDALYQTTVFDYSRACDGLHLSSLAKYSDQTIKSVTSLVKNLGLGESIAVHGYLAEFNSLMEGSHREKAIAA